MILFESLLWVVLALSVEGLWFAWRVLKEDQDSS
jgi:hypothetical protein